MNTRPVWRSRTGFYALEEQGGRYYPTTAGRQSPVALTPEEIDELRDALNRERPAPRKRPGPTETKISPLGVG